MLTHTANGKPSGIIEPDTAINRKRVVDFYARSDYHYERKKPTKIVFVQVNSHG